MCLTNHPTYVPHSQAGIKTANCSQDGYLGIEWERAYTDSINYIIAYNIYFSTKKEDVFAEGVKYVSIDPTIFQTQILDLTPGDTYFINVRATEFDPSWVNLQQLPTSGSSRFYPEGLLLSDVSLTDDTLSILDIDLFPPTGVVQVGTELIKYLNKDLLSNSLLNLTRGFLETEIRIHTVDGYDGYHTAANPAVYFWPGLEEKNQNIASETITFHWDRYAWTATDGYKEVTEDILTSDLGGTDAALGAISTTSGGTSDGAQAALPSFDYSGWRNTDLAALLRGDCLDSYFLGEAGCADGYEGTDRQVRGPSVNEASTQREEMLLEATGEAVLLIRRMNTGIRCKCYMSNSEYPDDRCISCHGSGWVIGYEPFYNPRRSDGRILVRFDPTEDDVKMQDAGYESTFDTNGWTLPMPSVKTRDLIQRYDQFGNRDWLYEVGAVTRNRLFLSETGSQKFKLKRIRKTDSLYTLKFIDSTAPAPQVVYTTLEGGAGIPPHSHAISIPPSTISLSQINTTTSVVAGHNHEIRNGILVLPNDLGHTHQLLFP